MTDKTGNCITQRVTEYNRCIKQAIVGANYLGPNVIEELNLRDTLMVKKAVLPTEPTFATKKVYADLHFVYIMEFDSFGFFTTTNENNGINGNTHVSGYVNSNTKNYERVCGYSNRPITSFPGRQGIYISR